MTTYTRGSVADLSVNFREYPPNGPLTNVNNISIEVVPLLGGASVLGPTSAGITNPAIGIYGYAWSIPIATPSGQYVVIWSGNDIGTGDPVQATEQIIITYQNALADGDGPCDWEIDTTCCPTWDQYTSAQQVIGFNLAAMILWGATGRRFGKCTLTVQPCRPQNPIPLYLTFPVPGYNLGGSGFYGAGQGGPVIEDGLWYNRCGPGCRCKARCEVELDGPTTTADVLEVQVNGVVVDPAVYQIQNFKWLVRIDGECWPTCVDYSQQSPPKFQVIYRRGDALPSVLKVAGGILACEFAKSCADDPSCRLPSHLTSLTQQGASVQISPGSEYIDLGLTNIAEVDRVIAQLNPNRLTQRPSIVSPDRRSPRMVT